MRELGTRVSQVTRHIREHWNTTVRRAGHDAYPLLEVPYPYTVPCPTDQFQELFYWDSYFTNLGLLGHGETVLARNNVDDLLHLVRSVGFVPNSNTVHQLNRSQPPYLAMMVRDVHAATNDTDWLREAYDVLRREYEFWTSRRSTPVGLSGHLHNASRHELLEFYDEVLVRRLGMGPASEEEKLHASHHYLAEAESGHDFTPRFHGRCAHFVPVDLNSNLFRYERELAAFSRILGMHDEQAWTTRSTERLRLMRRYCWDGAAGCFTDYDFRNDEPSGVICAAAFWPLAWGMATRAEAASTVRLLAFLERAHGVATCADGEAARARQWGYPNAWPPIQLVVVRALTRYGYDAAARRIAASYLRTVCDQFETTGHLWEKYDADTGEPGGAEYEPTKMLGWSAGVFVRLADFLALSD